MKGLLSVHAAFKNTLLHSHDITRMHMCERPQSWAAAVGGLIVKRLNSRLTNISLWCWCLKMNSFIHFLLQSVEFMTE